MKTGFDCSTQTGGMDKKKQRMATRGAGAVNTWMKVGFWAVLAVFLLASKNELSVEGIDEQCFNDAGEIFKGIADPWIDQTTKEVQAQQLSRMQPCDLLPLQITALPGGEVSRFHYLAIYDAVIKSLIQVLLGLDKTAECIGFKSFPFWPDIPSLIGDVGAIGEFAISLTDEEDRSKNPFLEFDPVPYKPAFAGGTEGCSATNAACNSNLPCCHSVDAATKKTWYIDCVDEVCEDHASVQSNKEHTCLARDAECSTGAECCQYSDDLDDIHVCQKSVDPATSKLSELGICQPQPPTPIGWNPICIAWNAKTDPLDTVAFAFPLGFPPLPFDPLGLNTLLPGGKKFAKAGPESLCKWHGGFPVIKTPKVTALFKFFGLAVSSGDRLEYGSNSRTRGTGYGDKVPRIWDGFLSLPLAPRPGIDFWFAFRLEFVPTPLWMLKEFKCKRAIQDAKATPSEPPNIGYLDTVINGLSSARDIITGQGSEISLRLDFEIYVDVGGSGGTSPCVIVAMPSATLKLSILQFRIGRGIGGYCENAIPNLCNPSGFFLNIEPTFEAKTYPTKGVLKLLLSGLEEVDKLVDEESVIDIDTTKEPITIEGGFSFGVFIDDVTKDVRSVVARLDFPTIEIFGFPLTPGLKMHFQWFKGSELERRRQSILRINGEPNCPDTVEGCITWKPYLNGTSDAQGMEICEDRLLELDRYNRIMVASISSSAIETPVYIDQDDKSSLPATWHVNQKFDQSRPNFGESSTIVVYAQITNWGNILVKLNQLSLCIIINTQTPLEYITQPLDTDADTITEEDSQAYVDAITTETTAIGESEDRQNVYIEADVQISVLYAIQFQAAISVQNNPGGSGDYDHWVVAFKVELDVEYFFTFTCIGNTAPFRWNAASRTRDLAEATDEEVRRRLEATPDPDYDLDISFDLGNLGEAILAGLKIVGEFLADVGKAILDGLIVIGEAIVEFFNDAADFFVDGFNAVANAVGGAIDYIASGQLGKDFLAAADAVAEFAAKSWNALVDFGKEVLAAVFGEGGFLDELLGPVDEALEGFFAGRSFSEYRFTAWTVVANCKGQCPNDRGACQFCHDDYKCPVLIRQRRDCSTESWCFSDCTDCTPWYNFDSKRDNACIQQVAREAVELDGNVNKTNDMNEVVRENNEENVKGLNYALENPGVIKTPVKVGTFNIASGGSPLQSVDMPARSEGMSVLQPDNDVPVEKNVDLATPPGGYPIKFFEAFDDAGNGRRLEGVAEEKIYKSVQESLAKPAQEAILAETKTEGTAFTDFQPKISPPTLVSKLHGRGSVELTWADCRDGKDDYDFVSIWSKGNAGIVGIVHKWLEETRRDDWVVEVDTDLSVKTTDMRWSTRKGYPINSCDEFVTIEELRVYDSGERASNSLNFTVKIPYGAPTIKSTLGRRNEIATRCHNNAIDESSLQWYGMDVPHIGGDRCPSPSLTLGYHDNTTQLHIPCTDVYEEIERTWGLISTNECQLPQIAEDVSLIQTITLGGLAVPTLSKEFAGTDPVPSEEMIDARLAETDPTPATPSFDVMNAIYRLSNERDNGSAIFELDDVLDQESKYDECGICNIETTPTPFADESVVGCGQVGKNIVSVTVTNNIGIKVTKNVEVLVLDEHPPVSQPKIPFPDVDLDSDEHASVSPLDIDYDSYDNCGIADRTLSRLPRTFGDACSSEGDACDFSCSDTYGGGPFDVYLTVTDPSGHQSTNSTSIKVLDSSDRDGDGFYDCAESLLFFTDPDEPDMAYVIDTAPDSENLPSVFPYRPTSQDPWNNQDRRADRERELKGSKKSSKKSNDDGCAANEIMGTIYELNGNGTMAPSSGTGSSYCPNGHLDFIEAQVVWPWINQDIGVDSGSKNAVQNFAEREDQEKLELEGKLFDVDKQRNLLVANKVPDESYFARLVVTDTETAMYARQVSQPIVKVTVRCHVPSKSSKKSSDESKSSKKSSKKSSDEDPPGMLFFRLSADHPACPGTRLERVQDRVCPGGLTVADYDGLRQAPVCHETSSRRTLRDRKKKAKKAGDSKSDRASSSGEASNVLGVDYYLTRSGKKASTCVLDRMGNFCRKEFIVEDRYCMNECINFDDKDILLGKGLETGQEYPVCCKP